MKVSTLFVCLVLTEQAWAYLTPKTTKNWGIDSVQKSRTSSNQHLPSTITADHQSGRTGFGLRQAQRSAYRKQTTWLNAVSGSNDNNEPIRIIISGAPASGKGTQCERIKEKYGVVHLSTGDMLRQAVADKTPVGLKAKEFMDDGKLVPDDVIIGIIRDRLKEEDCETCGWLLDGFPRTQAQAEALEGMGITADCFIFLNVPDEVLVERVVGRRTDPVTGKIYHMKFSPPEDETVKARLVQRSDDTEEKVKVRLEQFHANVDAVRNSYEDISITIDGTKKPDEVSKAIFEAIDTAIKGTVSA